MMDTPTMLASARVGSTYSAEQLSNFGMNAGLNALGRRIDQAQMQMAEAAVIRQHQQGQGVSTMPSRRVVQVIIADANENVPLEDCLLYNGDEKLTDATDQELFFELDIKEMLATHNAKRVKLVDKKVKDRVEYLEPAKVRDLKMVVVTVATL
jgi:hypothetical protein